MVSVRSPSSTPSPSKRRHPSPLRRAATDLLGRADVLAEADRLLRHGHHVLLYGPPGIGKSALIQSLLPRPVTVVDPFADVTPHAAARIRLAMDRATMFLGATRSLDREHLGAVRRIAWRFTTLRVPPLSGRWMFQLVARECARAGLLADLVTTPWLRAIAKLAHGRAGPALCFIRTAAEMTARRGVLPSPAAAACEGTIRHGGLSSLEGWN